MKCPVPITDELLAWAYQRAEMALRRASQHVNRPSLWEARLRLRELSHGSAVRAEKRIPKTPESGA